MLESLILYKIDHHAIIKFYGINFHSFDDPYQLPLTILTEYISEGSLKDILIKEQHLYRDSGWDATKKIHLFDWNC